MPQIAGLPLTLSIPVGAGLTNPAVAGNYTLTVDATGNAQGVSGNIAITAAAIVGGNVSLTSFVAGAQTAGTIQFTLGGPVASGDSIVLFFPAGWTVQTGAMTVGNWTGLAGAPASVTGNNATDTVSIVIGGTPQVATNVTLTIAASAELVNQTTAAAGLIVGFAATGSAAGNSNPFAVIAGTPTAAQSTVSRAPASVPADGATASTITVTLRDVNSNPASGRTVTLGQGAGTSTISAASGPSNGAGVVTFTVTSGTAQVVTYTATDATGAPIVITQTASVTFTAVAGTPVTGVSFYNANPDPGSPTTITATFTTSNTGALAATNTVTVVMAGFTHAAGAKTITLGGGFVGTATGNVAGGSLDTVTVTLAGGASLGNARVGTISFATTNPGRGLIAAALLTVATSQDVTVVASSNGMLIDSPPVESTPSGDLFVPPSFPTFTSKSDLMALSVTPGTLSPAFDPGVTTFTVTVPGDSLTLTATVATQGAQIQVNRAAATSGEAKTLDVPAGGLRIDIDVFGPDTTRKVYVIQVTRSAAPVTCATGFFLMNGTCVPSTVCNSGEYEAVQPTSTTDRQCRTVRACSSNQFEAAAPTSTTNRFCREVTVCPTGQVEVTPPSATRDRVCAADAGPKLTNLAVYPAGVSLDQILAQLIRVPVVDGQTAYTVNVAANTAYQVATEADGTVELSVVGGGIVAQDASRTAPVTFGITVRATSGATTPYTLTLQSTATVTCANSGTATTSGCVCTVGFTGATCETALAAQLCPVGTYSTTGNAPCTPAASGFYVPNVGSLSQLRCQDGTTSGAGASLCTALPALTNATVTPSSTVASASGVYRVSFVTPVAIPGGGKISVTLRGVSFALRQVQFLEPTGIGVFAASEAFGADVLTITNSPTPIPAGRVVIDVTLGTNPAVQDERRNVAMSVTDSAGAVLASTSSGTMPAIVAATGPVVERVSPDIGEPLTSNRVALYGTGFGTSPGDLDSVKYCLATSPCGPSDLVTLSNVRHVNSTQLMGTVPATLTAGQAIKFVVSVAGSAGLPSTAMYTVAPIYRIVVSSPISIGSGGTSATVTFEMQNANGSKASISNDNYRAMVLSSSTAAPTATAVILGTGAVGAPAVKAALANGAGSATITGLTAGTAYKVYVAVEGLGLVSAGVDFTTIAAATGITGVSFAVSDATPDAEATMTVTFTPGTGLVGGDRVRVEHQGHFSASANVVTTPVRGWTTSDAVVPVTLIGSFSASEIFVDLGNGTSLAAGTSASFSVTVTNPFTARTVPAASLMVSTSKDTTRVVSSNALVIASAPIGGLAFEVQPSGAIAPRQAFPTQPVVVLRTSDGSIDTTATRSVTLSIKDNTTANLTTSAGANTTCPSSTPFLGLDGRCYLTQAEASRVTVTMVAGKATFTGLNIDLAGTYQLVASATGLTSVDSLSFTVTASTVAALALQSPPTVTSTSVRAAVVLKDASGATVSAPAVRVRGIVYAAATAAPTAGAVLAGTGAVGTPGAAVLTNGGSAEVVTTGLTAATSYKLYVAGEGLPGLLAVDFQTPTSITGAAVTASSTAAGATGVTYTVKFTTSTAVPAGGKIRATMSGLIVSSTPTVTVSTPASTPDCGENGFDPVRNISCTLGTGTVANTANFADSVLTVTVNQPLAAGTVRFTVSGGTNPAVPQARVDNGVLRTTSSADVTLAETSTMTIPAITSGTAVTAVTISASSTVAGATTTITVGARYTTALVPSDAITVKLDGYTLPVGTIEVTAGTGISTGCTTAAGFTACLAGPGTLVGRVAAGATNTLVITGATVAAGTSATFTFPATNPGAAPIAAAGLTLRTSKDTTEVSSSVGFTIAAPQRTLRFRPQPAGAAPGALFTRQPVVEILGAGGAVDTTATDILVTLRIKAATGATGAVLTSTGVRSVAGVATFTDVKIDLAGTGYVLVASATGYADVESAPFDVGAAELAIPKLVFGTRTSSPPAFATVDTAFGFTVETRNSSGVAAGTSVVTLTSSPAGLTATATATAVNGVATFTSLKFSTVGTYTITATTTGFTSATTSITVQVTPIGAAPTQLVFRNVPSTAQNRRGFNLEVLQQDSSGTVFANLSQTITLSLENTVATSGTTLGPASNLSQTTVGGVATFTGIYVEGPAQAVTIRASSSLGLSARTGSISLTRPFAYFAFSQVPTDETSNVAFGVQPTVGAYATDGAVLTSYTGTITLTATAGTTNPGVVTLANASATTPITANLINGVAAFTGIKAITTTEGNYILNATGSTGGTASVNFWLYTSQAAAATQRAKEQSQSKTFAITLGLDTSILQNAQSKSLAEAALKSDLCLAANLAVANCNILVELKAARATPPSDIVRAAQVAPANDNIITLTAPTMESVERLLGPAPSGTSILGVIGLSGRTAQGDVMYGPSRGPMQLTLMVAASEVLPGALAGDLKAAGWNSQSKRWEFIPARSVKNSDGSFSITTEVNFFGVIATIYAPGAGQIAAFTGFSAQGAGFGVFAGSPVAADLGRAAAQHQADGVWLQDSNGQYQLLVLGGPAFLARDFEATFHGGIAPNTAVTLVRREAA